MMNANGTPAANGTAAATPVTGAPQFGANPMPFPMMAP